MPINLPQPTLDRDQFNEIATSLPHESAERIAEAFPALFSPAFVFGDAPAAPEPAKPALAKTKPTKTSPSAPKADRTMLIASVESVMATHPKKTAPEYTELLASIAGDDPKFGVKVRRACEALVTAGKACFEGEHKNRRYWPTPRGNAQEPEQGE